MKKITLSKAVRFCQLYLQGLSMREIFRKESVSVNSVKKYLIENNVDVKTKNIVYEVKENNDLLIGVFIGIWAGDGTKFVDKGYKIKIFGHLKDAELTKYTQELLLRIFNKISHAVNENGNRMVIKFGSKFIYNYIDNFLAYGKNKTYTIRLKNDIGHYSIDFLDGFFLGLMLSDGYLKDRFYFNTTSEQLAENMIKILSSREFHPKKYVHKREKYGWKNLTMVTLNVNQSKKALKLLDIIVKKTGYNKGFSILKGYKIKKSGPTVI